VEIGIFVKLRRRGFSALQISYILALKLHRLINISYKAKNGVGIHKTFHFDQNSGIITRCIAVLKEGEGVK